MMFFSVLLLLEYSNLLYDVLYNVREMIYDDLMRHTVLSSTLLILFTCSYSAIISQYLWFYVAFLCIFSLEVISILLDRITAWCSSAWCDARIWFVFFFREQNNKCYCRKCFAYVWKMQTLPLRYTNGWLCIRMYVSHLLDNSLRSNHRHAVRPTNEQQPFLLFKNKWFRFL